MAALLEMPDCINNGCRLDSAPWERYHVGTRDTGDLKNLLKGAAISAIGHPGPLQDFYAARVEKGMRPSLARLTLARKIAAITLIIWKKGASFDPKQLQRQAA